MLKTGYAVVFPEYKLAPEAKWPEQQEQCFDVLEWVTKNGKSHNVIPDNFAIVADSAAGKLTPFLGGHRRKPIGMPAYKCI